MSAANAAKQFSLDFLAPVLKEYRMPQEPLDASGTWTQRYTIHALEGKPERPAGDLRISRTPAAGGLRLEVVERKLLGAGRSHRIAATVQCANDALATPASWSVTEESAAPQGGELHGLKLVYTAAAQSGKLEISAGDAKRTANLSGAFTLPWCILEAVQRMSSRKQKELRFSLVDYHGAVHPDQTLAPRAAASVELGGQAVILQAFEHTGRGIYPWIYWLDERGRLIIAVSGLEAVVLDSKQA